jgi:hypothetical protein
MDAYEDCSLANPASLNGGNKTRRPGTVTAGICEMLMDHTDAIHYMIQRFLGASVSDQLFASILEKFHAQEGYLYREVSTSICPMRCHTWPATSWSPVVIESRLAVRQGAHNEDPFRTERKRTGQADVRFECTAAVFRRRPRRQKAGLDERTDDDARCRPME